MNYTTALDRISIGKSYINSLVMSGSTVLLVLIFGGLAAYVLSRFNFAGKRAIYSLLYATLLIPAFATVVPVYELLRITSYNVCYTKLLRVGWDNFERLFTDKLLGAATLHTLELMLYVLLFQVGIALVLAVLVEAISRLKTFYRTVFFFPVVISGTAIVITSYSIHYTKLYEIRLTISRLWRAAPT